MRLPRTPCKVLETRFEPTKRQIRSVGVEVSHKDKTFVGDGRLNKNKKQKKNKVEYLR